MVLADEKSRPVSVIIASASVHEVRLVEEVIRQRASKARPRRITADWAYDSDAPDKKLKRKGIELNAPLKNAGVNHLPKMEENSEPTAGAGK